MSISKFGAKKICDGIYAVRKASGYTLVAHDAQTRQYQVRCGAAQEIYMTHSFEDAVRCAAAVGALHKDWRGRPMPLHAITKEFAARV